MNPPLLTLNAGSSSIKFAVFEVGAERAHLIGQVDGLGAATRFSARSADGRFEDERDWPEELAPQDHVQAMHWLVHWLTDRLEGRRPAAVGHRVVHGGPSYHEPVRIDDAVLADLRRLEPLAPLHQPHNLMGIAAARSAFGAVPQVACFDTAFHRAHAFVHDCFGLPRSYYEEGVRRYGFHGLSYEHIAAHLRRHWPRQAAGRVLVAHLGNGSSMCAIQDGVSVASTMGFSPLDGLPMGTRCGQIDPGVLLYLLEHKGMSPAELSDLLYRHSGLQGLSGLSHDMRTLQASVLPAAKEAIDYFVSRIRLELGALSAALGGLDAFVFTGGIGEHAAAIRAQVLQGMAWLGIELDAARNAAQDTVISSDASRVLVLRVPADEEAMIARHTERATGLAQEHRP